MIEVKINAVTEIELPADAENHMVVVSRLSVREHTKFEHNWLKYSFS